MTRCWAAELCSPRRRQLPSPRLFPTSYLRDELRLSWMKAWKDQNLPASLARAQTFAVHRAYSKKWVTPCPFCLRKLKDEVASKLAICQTKAVTNLTFLSLSPCLSLSLCVCLSLSLSLSPLSLSLSLSLSPSLPVVPLACSRSLSLSLSLSLARLEVRHAQSRSK